MKSAFTWNGQHYLSPSKKEARKFLKMYGGRSYGPYRFVTNWRFETIEKAPSYCQMMKISSDKVEFGML